MAEWLKAAVLKTAEGLKGPSGGSNPSPSAKRGVVVQVDNLRIVIAAERWPSGRRRSPAKRVWG